MKKAIVVALTAGLLAGALVGPADAGKKKKKPVPPPPAPVKIERVVDLEYSVPPVGVASDVETGGVCLLDASSPGDCVEIPLQAGEAFVKLAVTDKSGQQVYGSLSQGDTDGDGIGNLYGELCGAHTEPVEMLSQSVPLGISLYSGSSSACKQSVVVGGTLTATFSNIP